MAPWQRVLGAWPDDQGPLISVRIHPSARECQQWLLRAFRNKYPKYQPLPRVKGPPKKFTPHSMHNGFHLSKPSAGIRPALQLPCFSPCLNTWAQNDAILQNLPSPRLPPFLLLLFCSMPLGPIWGNRCAKFGRNAPSGAGLRHFALRKLVLPRGSTRCVRIWPPTPPPPAPARSLH